MQDITSYPFAIFDMDGTLVDSMPFWHNMGRDYLRARGCEPEEDLNAVLKTQTLQESAVYFREHYGLNETPEEIRAGFDALIEENYRSRVPAKPGTKELLALLASRGVRMSVFSSTPDYLVSMALERLGLHDYFEAIVNSAEAGAGKREPEAYLQVCGLLGYDPKETVMFEDADFAIFSAAAAGLHVAAVYDKSCCTPEAELRRAAEWYIRDYRDWPALKTPAASPDRKKGENKVKVTAAIQVLPAVTGNEEICRIVDEVIAYIAASGLHYEVGPLETTIEGDDYEQIMEIVKNCQLIALDAGCDKVSAYIKLIARREGDILSIDEKIGKYRA